MQDTYDFGASFNCRAGGDDIGGGGEGYTTLDYITNDLDKLKDVMLAEQAPNKFKWDDAHDLIGESTNNGGDIVAVMVEIMGDDEHVVAVIFVDPDSIPTIV